MSRACGPHALWRPPPSLPPSNRPGCTSTIDADLIIMSHIHQGGPTDNGPPVVGLSPPGVANLTMLTTPVNATEADP